MKAKYTPEDAAAGKPVPREAAELLAEIQPRLHGLGGSQCRLKSLTMKFSKMLMEFDACRADGQVACSCFAKSFNARACARTFATLSALTEAGFCPPSRFTVTRPLAHLEKRAMLVVEKAPGAQFTKFLLDGAGDAAQAADAAAGWLATLHSSKVNARGRRSSMRRQLRRFSRELAEALPQHAPRIREIEKQLSATIDRKQRPVPSHRDFHPDNIFLAPDGRVTLIDLDQFGMQEPAGDAAYCAAQMAIMSFLRTGTFDTTAVARQRFAHAYLQNSREIDPQRLAWHFAFSFLKSLHYEWCVFHTGNTKIVQPWLSAAEHSLRDGEMTLPSPAIEAAAAKVSSAAAVMP